MRKYRDDPAPIRDPGLEGLPLAGWPERPREEAHQNVLPLEPSTEARWLAWKATDEGERFIEAVRIRAIAKAKMGEPVVRVKAIIEEVRDKLHISVDNRLQSYISRELALNPMLDPLIERRVKKAI